MSALGERLHSEINLLFPAKVQLWGKGDVVGFTEGAGAGKSIPCEEQEWPSRQPGGHSRL